MYKIPLIALLLLSIVRSLYAENPAPDASRLTASVLEIFDRSCKECHDTKTRRPKGGFGTIMDLEKLVTQPEYLIPGEPEESEVYLLSTDPDPEFRMPPPDSDYPQLTKEQEQILYDWILAGAPTQTTTTLSAVPQEHTDSKDDGEPEADNGEEKVSEKEQQISDEVEEIEKERQLDIERMFALSHPIFVHFPIALLLAGILAEYLRLFPRFRETLKVTVTWCLVLGTLGAVVSIASGWLNAPIQGYSDATVQLHRWSGVSILALSVIALFLIIPSERGGSARVIFRVILAILAIGIFIVGHSGGELVYGEGYLW